MTSSCKSTIIYAVLASLCRSHENVSNSNPLDLVERDLVAGAVVELGGAGGFVCRDHRGVFGGAAVLEVGGDAGGSESVAAGGVGES